MIATTLIILLIISTYIILNLYRKLRKAEAAIVQLGIDNDVKYIQFYKVFKEISNNIAAVDKKASFKSEDEVGYAWNLFMDLNQQLDELFKTIITE